MPCLHASEGIHPGFETQGRRHQKSKTGISAPRKGGGGFACDNNAHCENVNDNHITAIFNTLKKKQLTNLNILQTHTFTRTFLKNV